MNQSLNAKIAETIYTADAQPVEWSQAISEDRAYYTRIADVIVDIVVEHLSALDIPTDAVVAYLQTDADIDRLRREVVA